MQDCAIVAGGAPAPMAMRHPPAAVVAAMQAGPRAISLEHAHARCTYWSHSATPVGACAAPGGGAANGKPGAWTPVGMTATPGIWTPCGVTEMPGICTPPGVTEMPGIWTPCGVTEMPGIITPFGPMTMPGG